MYIDIHCHLDKCEDTQSTIKRAVDAGIVRMITNGTKPETNRTALSLSKQDHVDAAIGLYPTDALEMTDDQIKEELSFIEQTKPIAIGEVGLDFVDDAQKERQVQIFRDVISLSLKIDRPLIIHSRKAERAVVELLEELKPRANLHCFCGSLKLVKRAVQVGCFFSIPPIILRSTHFQRLVEETPITHLLTETDSPYLSPDENPNEPKNVIVAVEQIAKIKGITVTDCANQLWMNAQRFLR